jgi:hypothetical protein
MQASDRNVTYMLWTVVGALVVGASIAVFMLVHHADDLTQANAVLTGDNHNLQRQLADIRATLPAPTPTTTVAQP